MPHCSCGSGRDYVTCCQPYVEGRAHPETPEALMRSRYTAYTMADIDYIEKTEISQRFLPGEAHQFISISTLTRLVKLPLASIPNLQKT